nr:SLBB domain-containing protein [Armatimonadota bacterium]
GKIVPLDLRGLLKGGDMSLNQKLAPGDVINIPSQPTTIGILGEAKTPGNVPYHDGMTLIDALTTAGGVTEHADLDSTTVIHNGQQSKLKLRSLLNGDLTLNEKLSPGDVINIPLQRAQVSVLGEVTEPGSIPYHDDVTVLNALGAVKGVKDTADLSGAVLTHDGKETPLDLDAMLHHGDMTGNITLSPGDQIVVPEVHNRTYVFGAVTKPGYYISRPGDRLLDAINGAGGTTTEADMGQINVVDIDKTKSAATVKKVDMNKFLKKGDLTANLVVVPGEVIFVPDKKKGFNLGQMVGLLSGLSLVGSAFRIFGL